MSTELYKKFTTNKRVDITYFTSEGEEYNYNTPEHEDEENEDREVHVLKVHNICAKKVIGETTRYFIKTVGNRELYNPEKEYRKTDVMNKIKFISVGETQFELYLRFLRTRQIHSLRQAQRECRI